MLVVAEAAFDAAAEARVVAQLGARLGQPVRVRVERVAEIAPERSGKYRYVVSRVNHASPVAHAGAPEPALSDHA